VELSELLQRLRELAAEAGLEVRDLRSHSEGQPAPASGVCRVRGETWVLLAASDALEERVEVLAQALKTHAAQFLESRYLPPAVRARLSAGPELG
jgi:hypothetical protein